MASSSNIYVGVAGYFGKPDQTGKVGVFRRSTAGGDWQHVLGSVEAYTVFVHPSDAGTVFAGTSDGVWRSTDAGATLSVLHQVRRVVPKRVAHLLEFESAVNDPSALILYGIGVSLFTTAGAARAIAPA